MAFKHSSWFHC